MFLHLSFSHSVHRGVCVAGGCAWQRVRAGDTATEVRGTHPTGMHSWFSLDLLFCC